MHVIHHYIRVIALIAGLCSYTGAITQPTVYKTFGKEILTVADLNSSPTQITNYIINNFLGGGNTFTIASGDSSINNGLAIMDSARVTGLFQLRADTRFNTNRAHSLGSSAERGDSLWYGVLNVKRGLVDSLSSVGGDSIRVSDRVTMTDSLNALLGIRTGRLEADGGGLLGGAFVTNDAGADVDQRMEGDTETNLFYLNAGEDNIGFGADPSTNVTRLYVYDNVTTARAGAYFVKDNASATTETVHVRNDGSGAPLLQLNGRTSDASGQGFYSYIVGDGTGIADDAVEALFTRQTSVMWLRVFVTDGSTNHQWAVIGIRANSSPSLTILTQGGDGGNYTFETSTADLTSSPGNDNKITVSAQSGGAIQMNNRAGATIYYFIEAWAL